MCWLWNLVEFQSVCWFCMYVCVCRRNRCGNNRCFSRVSCSHGGIVHASTYTIIARAHTNIQRHRYIPEIISCDHLHWLSFCLSCLVVFSSPIPANDNWQLCRRKRALNRSDCKCSDSNRSKFSKYLLSKKLAYTWYGIMVIFHCTRYFNVFSKKHRRNFMPKYLNYTNKRFS